MHTPHQTVPARHFCSRSQYTWPEERGGLLAWPPHCSNPSCCVPRESPFPLRDRNRRRIVLLRAMGLRLQAAVRSRATVRRTAAAITRDRRPARTRPAALSAAGQAKPGASPGALLPSASSSGVALSGLCQGRTIPLQRSIGSSRQRRRKSGSSHRFLPFLRFFA